MKPLDFYLVKYDIVCTDLGLSPDPVKIREYLDGGRHDVLENVDLFLPNVRSTGKGSRFDLFRRVDRVSPGCVVVIGLYLEFLEFWGQREKIRELVGFYCNLYPNNVVVASWNHDTDAASVFTFLDDFPNFRLLNFNTSVNHPQYILLPFWTIDGLESATKNIFANYTCSLNNSLRQELFGLVSQDSRFYINNRLSRDEYLRVVSSSTFTLCPKGVGLSSYRFFESIANGSIPILIADSVILPFPDLDYSSFIIRIPESSINTIVATLDSVETDDLLTSLGKNQHRFTLAGCQQEIYNRLL